MDSRNKKFSKEHPHERLTDCCGAFSTYHDDGVLACRRCLREVSFGEGDGTETETVVK